MTNIDHRPCVEADEHVAIQRHTPLECPVNDDLREALNISTLVKVTDLKHGQHISLGTLGSAQVVGTATCVYPFKKATLAVLISSGVAVLELPSGTMVETQEVSA